MPLLVQARVTGRRLLFVSDLEVGLLDSPAAIADSADDLEGDFISVAVVLHIKTVIPL